MTEPGNNTGKRGEVFNSPSPLLAGLAQLAEPSSWGRDSGSIPLSGTIHTLIKLSIMYANYDSWRTENPWDGMARMAGFRDEEDYINSLDEDEEMDDE